MEKNEQFKTETSEKQTQIERKYERFATGWRLREKEKSFWKCWRGLRELVPRAETQIAHNFSARRYRVIDCREVYLQRGEIGKRSKVNMLVLAAVNRRIVELIAVVRRVSLDARWRRRCFRSLHALSHAFSSSRTYPITNETWRRLIND